MFDVEKAIFNPASVFKKPADVLKEKALTKEQKIEVLQRWEFDAKEREIAEEENMHSSQVDILDDILSALHTLGVFKN